MLNEGYPEGQASFLCDVVFPSKQAGKVDGFLNRHQIAVVSAVEPNSAG